MLLNLANYGPKMKLVYDFAEILKEDTEQVRLAQALTLDTSRPRMGLSGNHGLFGSEEWWESIKNGRIKTATHSGIIEKTYFAGQDARWGNQINSFSLRLLDGSLIEQSIYVMKKTDQSLFVPGATVIMISALDELKFQPALDGGKNYSTVVLEVAISD